MTVAFKDESFAKRIGAQSGLHVLRRRGFGAKSGRGSRRYLDISIRWTIIRVTAQLTCPTLYSRLNIKHIEESAISNRSPPSRPHRGSRKDYCGWLLGRVRSSMSSDRARGRGQWSIAGDIGFRPTYRSD